MAKQFPNPDQKWQPGQSGNPGGKTSEHRANEVKAAEIAARARLGLVEAFANLLDGKATVSQKELLLKIDALRLLKDSEDRGFGTPVHQVDNTSSDGSAVLPNRIVLVGPE